MPTFAAAVDMHKAMVFSIAWHFLRNRAATEELAQDVFLQLHQNWHSIKSPNHLLFWLRQTATHRCVDASRRHKAKPETSLSLAPEPANPHVLPDPLLSEYLGRLIATLPEAQRSVVILRYQEDLLLEEVAQLLNLNLSTVKTHLARGLQFLRQKCSTALGQPPTFKQRNI